MIVIDSSVVVAILTDEPGAVKFSTFLGEAGHCRMSAGTFLETAIVLDRRYQLLDKLEAWVGDRDIEVVPVDLFLARLGVEAFARFGKGRHAAGLNYGDCFSYALAKALRAPLLFKGDDFARTDIEPALR